MFGAKDQILSQLRAGEDGRAEFKEVRLGDRGVTSPDTEDLAGELVAFANAEGGVVFLGVDDSGAVRGVPPEGMDTVESWVINVATHNCDPPIRPTLRKEMLPGATGDDQRILLAEAPRGLYVHRTSGGRYYLRVGSTKRDLTPRSLPGSSTSGVVNTYSTSNPCSLQPSTISIATGSKHFSDVRRPSPGSICCGTRG